MESPLLELQLIPLSLIIRVLWWVTEKVPVIPTTGNYLHLVEIFTTLTCSFCCTQRSIFRSVTHFSTWLYFVLNQSVKSTEREVVKVNKVPISLLCKVKRIIKHLSIYAMHRSYTNFGEKNFIWVFTQIVNRTVL